MVRHLTSRSLLRISDTVTVHPAVTTLTSATKPTLIISAIPIIDSPYIVEEYFQLAKTTDMGAGRPDSFDGGFVPALVFSSLARDVDRN